MGGRRPQGPPLRRITEHFEKRREGKPLPYGFPEMTLELGRGAPWVSRRGIRIRPVGGPGVPPLQEREREPGPSSAPVCAPGTCPYPLCPFGTSSLPLLAFGQFPLTGGIGPLTRGVGPQGGGLRKNKKGQVLDLSLKTQRRSGASHKISLPPFFFKERRGPGAPAPGPVP